MGTVFIQKESGDARHVRLNNSTGANLAQDQFTVIGGLCLVADEAIADGEVGSFAIMEDILGQVDDLLTGSLTFGTVNATVFWDPTTGDFSDTSAAGDYPVGIVQTVKDSNGMVLVYFNRNTAVVA